MKFATSHRLSFLVLLVFSNIAVAGEGLKTLPIDCANAPGVALCHDIRVMESYFIPCTEGCDGLMTDQSYYLNQVSETYFKVVLPGSDIAQDLGLQAQHAASTICAYHWKNVSNTNELSRWVISANRALNNLRDLQLSSEIPAPKYCQMRIEN